MISPEPLQLWTDHGFSGRWNQSTWGNPTQTQGEHADSIPKGLGPGLKPWSLLLWGDATDDNTMVPKNVLHQKTTKSLNI